MPYSEWFNTIIRCPETLEMLTAKGNKYVRSDGKTYPIINGILSIVYPTHIGGEDAKMNKFYDAIAPFYDFTQRILGKLLIGIDVIKSRAQIVALFGLKSGMRILEVSPGPGVFQPYLRQQIGDKGEIVALDLSLKMLRQCQSKNKNLNVHLVHGNAHHLPFADNSFDAVFHFGGVNLFNDPQKAILEFVRVTKKEE